jgi:hypothetical protein
MVYEECKILKVLNAADRQLDRASSVGDLSGSAMCAYEASNDHAEVKDELHG